MICIQLITLLLVLQLHINSMCIDQLYWTLTVETDLKHSIAHALQGAITHFFAYAVQSKTQTQAALL